MTDINELVSLIGETQQFFRQQAQRQVNTSLTLRNWLFGFYISEYELQRDDRAEYGAKAFKEIVTRLEKKGFNEHVKGMCIYAKTFIRHIPTFCG